MFECVCSVHQTKGRRSYKQVGQLDTKSGTKKNRGRRRARYTQSISKMAAATTTSRSRITSSSSTNTTTAAVTTIIINAGCFFRAGSSWKLLMQYQWSYNWQIAPNCRAEPQLLTRHEFCTANTTNPAVQQQQQKQRYKTTTHRVFCQRLDTYYPKRKPRKEGEHWHSFVCTGVLTLSAPQIQNTSQNIIY